MGLSIYCCLRESLSSFASDVLFEQACHAAKCGPKEISDCQLMERNGALA